MAASVANPAQLLAFCPSDAAFAQRVHVASPIIVFQDRFVSWVT
jgi:hypothetical protein